MNITNVIAQIPNWHRYVVGFLVGIGTLITILQADPTLLPVSLAGVVPYERLVLVIDLIALGGSPRFQLPTGPGAPPVTSPPTPGQVPHG
jgi:hypothetical protein